MAKDRNGIAQGLVVSNVPSTLDVQDMEAVFSGFGKITKLHRADLNVETQRAAWTLEFEDFEASERVYNLYSLGNTEIKVKKCLADYPKESGAPLRKHLAKLKMGKGIVGSESGTSGDSDASVEKLIASHMKDFDGAWVRVMIKHLPNYLTRGDLIQKLSEYGLDDMYRSISVPVDPLNGKCKGYAFASVLPENLDLFSSTLNGKHWPSSKKVTQVCIAKEESSRHKQLKERVLRSQIEDGRVMKQTKF